MPDAVLCASAGGAATSGGGGSALSVRCATAEAAKQRAKAMANVSTRFIAFDSITWTLPTNTRHDLQHTGRVGTRHVDYLVGCRCVAAHAIEAGVRVGR